MRFCVMCMYCIGDLAVSGPCLAIQYILAGLTEVCFLSTFPDPELQQWALRANLCDKLTIPVSAVCLVPSRTMFNAAVK